MNTKLCVILTLILVFLGFSLIVRAGTAAELESYCTSTDEALDFYCLGYINGVLEGFMFAMPLNQKSMCVPGDAMSHDQAKRIVLKYIALNPEILQYDARSVVVKVI